MIFIDADAFIGLSYEYDVHSVTAVDLFVKLTDLKVELFTSWDVVDEVATKLSQFATKSTAEGFLNFLKNSEIEVKFTDLSVSKKAVDLFKKQTSKNVSLTDCANMVIAKDLGIDTIFSFDKHYKQNGFKLLQDTI